MDDLMIRNHAYFPLLVYSKHDSAALNQKNESASAALLGCSTA